MGLTYKLRRYRDREYTASTRKFRVWGPGNVLDLCEVSFCWGLFFLALARATQLSVPTQLGIQLQQPSLKEAFREGGAMHRAFGDLANLANPVLFVKATAYFGVQARASFDTQHQRAVKSMYFRSNFKPGIDYWNLG